MLKYLLTTQWFIFEGGRYFELEEDIFGTFIEQSS